MEQKRQRRRIGRPTHALVTPEGIAQAALSVITDHGYEKLTMTRIASALGVSPSALYNHIDSKEDILRLVEDELMGRLTLDDLCEMPWENALQTWARRYLAIFSDHTPLIPIIAVLPVARAPRTVQAYETVTAILHRAGVPEPAVLPAIVALESFLFGTAFDSAAPADIFTLDDAEAEAAPLFQRAVQSAAHETGHYHHSPAFEFGLSALTGAIAALIQAPPPASVSADG
jgi:AcrR family transcriptional regulator